MTILNLLKKIYLESRSLIKFVMLLYLILIVSTIFEFSGFDIHQTRIIFQDLAEGLDNALGHGLLGWNLTTLIIIISLIFLRIIDYLIMKKIMGSK
jgi:uncharacterized membrane protein